MKKRPTNVCARCGSMGDLSWCQRCKTSCYCCAECQEADAERHMPECEQRRAEMLALETRTTEHRRKLREGCWIVCGAKEAEGKLCLICHEAMLTEASIMPLTCGHFFHVECIKMLRATAETIV